MAYITSEGTNLFVDVSGQGVPVLFAHGFGMDHRQWDPQCRDWSRGAQVIRMDLRAHGKSASSAKGYSWSAMARDLERVLYQAGVDRLNPGFVVAHSLSADAALQVALDEPRSLRGVVIVTPVVWGQPWSDDFASLWRDMQREARAGRVEGALARYRADTLFDGVRDLTPAWAAIEDMQRACLGAHLLHDERDSGLPTLERLATCKVPLLVIVGKRDRADFRRAAAVVAAAAPRVELRELDCGHFPNLERPAEFNALLHEFVVAHSN